ncbi:MAG: hypothetical protein CI949_3310 [Halanaerobium sp.]|nr:MAG: hypothetical protein CI949_3310 [Halanaerobium sp.]
MAQLGSALRSGRRGPGFKSPQPDHFFKNKKNNKTQFDFSKQHELYCFYLIFISIFNLSTYFSLFSFFIIERAITIPETDACINPLVIPAPSPPKNRFSTLLSRLLSTFKREE